MHKTSTINIRIAPKKKALAEKILHKIGLSSAEAIRLFYTQVCLNKGLPFAIQIPNKQTSKAINNARRGKNLVFCKNAEDMFNKLDIKCTN
jgi:DNA-damage-inducible protein J